MNRIPNPLVSSVCVTENRPEFMPWLLWNFDKQDWPNRELVIIDSSRLPVELPARDDIRVVRAPAGSNIARKRNIALQHVRGDIISWFDDDDWQHPEKLSTLVKALQDRFVWAGNDGGWFMNLLNTECKRYQGINGHVVFNSAGFRCDEVRRFKFPENMQKASDTRWLTSIQRAFPRSAHIIYEKILFFWLCHHNNISNGANRRRFGWPLERLRKAIGSEAWADTDAALQELQSRLRGEKRKAASVISAIPRPARESTLQTCREKVSACLISWKRSRNLQRIVDYLGEHHFIDEIIVWNNDPSTDLTLRGQKVRVISSAENRICYARYLCAAEARNEVIYVQDDDVLPENISSLYQRFMVNSERIVHNLATAHYTQRERGRYGQAFNALLGWGAFFKREWIKVLDTYLHEYGEDYLLRREADKIFSLMLNTKHEACKARLCMLPGYASAGVALYLEQEHQRHKALAVSRALGLLRNQRSVKYPVTWNVVITCHNYGRYLVDCIESVLLNDADYIITLVDDASEDDTARVAQVYGETYSHIHYVRLEENKGVGFARNVGIAAENSLFVVLLDADDKIGPGYLYEAEKLLKEGSDVVNPDAILFGDRNARWTTPERVTYTMQRQRNYVHCCAAFRRSYWEQVGGIDETLVNWQDYDFWTRITRQGARVRRLSGNHFFYRKHGDSKSSLSHQRRKKLREVFRLRYSQQ